MEVRGCGYACSEQAIALQPKWEPEETKGIDTSLKHQEGTHTMKRGCIYRCQLWAYWVCPSSLTCCESKNKKSHFVFASLKL